MAVHSGILVAAIVGILSIKLVQMLVKSNKFKIFWIYTGILGVLTVTVAIIEAVIGHPLVLG